MRDASKAKPVDIAEDDDLEDADFTDLFGEPDDPADYDAWYKKEVEETLEGVRNGTVRLIGEEEWEEISKEMRAELERKVREQGQ
jgi:hypothetical protein